MKAAVALFPLALLLGACSTVHSETAGRDGTYLIVEGLEPVYSVSATKAGLAVRVSSNGCTKAEDFTVSVEKAPGGPVLNLVRTRPDPCRAFAMGGTVVVFDYEAIGLSGDFRLANPLARWTGPGE